MQPISHLLRPANSCLRQRKAAGYSITQSHFPNPNQNDYDILQAIFRLKDKLNIQVSYKHVEGHQATKYPEQTLDKWALLNEEMDSLAKSYLSYSASYPPLKQQIDDQEWAVSITDHKICKQFKQQLAFHLRAQQIKQFWTQSVRAHPRSKPPKYTDEQIDIVDTAYTQIV